MSSFIITTAKKNIWYNNGTHQNSAEQTTKTKKETKTRSAAKNVVNLSFPIFKEIATLTDDPFWIEIFTNFSIGIFKRGFSYTSINDDIYSGILTYKLKTKELQCYVSKDPETALNEVRKFMREDGGIMSEIDKASNTNEMQQQLSIKSENGVENWSKIRNNISKKILTSRFAKQYCIDNNIPSDRASELKDIIDLNLLLGKIEIKMSDGLISEIPSLSFVDDQFIINLPPNKAKFKNIDIDEEDILEENYNTKICREYLKFLNDLENRVAKRKK